MKTYLVELRETWVYQMLVDAEDSQQAHGIATDRWNGSVDEGGQEQEEPISVTGNGEPVEDGEAVVCGEVKRIPEGWTIHHVGKDGRDLN